MATLAKTARTLDYTVVANTAGPFSLGFRVFDTDGFEVWVNDVLIDPADYTINATFSGGYTDAASITFDTALEIDDELIVHGAMVAGRAGDLGAGASNLVADMNIELPRLAAMNLEGQRDAARSLKVISGPVKPYRPTDGSVPMWSASEGGFVDGPTSDEVSAAQGYAEQARTDKETVEGIAADFGDVDSAIDAAETASDASAASALAAAASAADAADASLNRWFLAGDGLPLDVVIDTQNANCLTLDGSGDVDEIASLGRVSGVFSCSGATNSTVTVRTGMPSIDFDGGSTFAPYDGDTALNTYASTFFDSTFAHFVIAAISQNATNSTQSPISVGATGASNPRFDLVYNSNGTVTGIENHDGTTLETVINGSLARTADQVVLSAGFHNGTDEATLWQDGALLALKEEELDLAAQNAPTTDLIRLGAIGNGLYDVDGGLFLAGVDNRDSLSFDAAFAKYLAAYNRVGLTRRPAFGLWSLGQSNALADFTNSDPLTFAAGEAYYHARAAGYSGLLDRNGFSHGDTSIGESSPALYFADEFASITGQVPIFQELAFAGVPITPGLTGKSSYWAPKNSVGDAAGDTSIMVTWETNFRRFRDILRYSPEFDVRYNIGFIVEGEADAVGFTDGDDVTTEALVNYINSWLNDLRATYELTHFAIVKIGRRGTDATAVAANAAGITEVNDAWDQIIASRSDCYDVFPHLNNADQSPFALDDLVTSADGAWVSGVGYQADGLHFTDEMFQAFGRTAARNFAQQLGIA